MTNLIVRANKIIVGTSLIVITMLWSSSEPGLILLPLVAAPIVLSGMFDWRPLEFLLGKLVTMVVSKTHGMKTGVGPA